MTATANLQILYNRLYKQLRKYIWDFSIVESIADFEVIVYQRFPDISELKRAYNKLLTDIKHTDVYKDDDDLKSAFEKFSNTLDDIESIYSDITTFQEVITQ